MLGKMVAEVNGKQVAAGNAVNNLQAGNNVSLHQAVIAMEEANVSFQLMLEVRNKLLDSYRSHEDAGVNQIFNFCFKFLVFSFATKN